MRNFSTQAWAACKKELEDLVYVGSDSDSDSDPQPAYMKVWVPPNGGMSASAQRHCQAMIDELLGQRPPSHDARAEGQDAAAPALEWPASEHPSDDESCADDGVELAEEAGAPKKTARLQ